MPKFEFILKVPCTVTADTPAIARALLEGSARELKIDGGEDPIFGEWGIEPGVPVASAVRGPRPVASEVIAAM